MGKEKLIELIIFIFGKVSPVLQDYILAQLPDLLDKAEEYAKKTETPFDDVGVMIAKKLVEAFLPEKK